MKSQDLLNKSIYTLVFLGFVLLLPVSGFDFDIGSWAAWAGYIKTHGLTHVYESGANYPPIFMYVLYGFNFFFSDVQSMQANIHYLKLATLAAEFVGAFFVLQFIKDKRWHVFYFLLLLLNPAYFYNSVIWGQVDGILATFIFISFFFAWHNKILPACVCFLIALNFKLQGIIFLPFIFFLLLLKNPLPINAKGALKGILLLLAIQLVILLPFIVEGKFNDVIEVYSTSVGYYPFVSMNAFNFWYFFIKDPHSTEDTLSFLCLSYRIWGLLLFFITAGLALWPMILGPFKRLFARDTVVLNLEKAMLIGILLPVLFFYFNTEMHERYVHPALIFMGAYAFVSRRYLPYIVGSAAYFLNMEHILHYFKLNNYHTLIFEPVFISSLYFIVILYCFYRLYWPSRRSKPLVPVIE